jgi:hypothetical protein
MNLPPCPNSGGTQRFKVPRISCCVHTSRLRCNPDAGGLPSYQSIFSGTASDKTLCPPLCGVLTSPRPPNPEFNGQLFGLPLRTDTLNPLDSGNAKRVFGLTVNSFWRGFGAKNLVLSLCQNKVLCRQPSPETGGQSTCSDAVPLQALWERGLAPKPRAFATTVQLPKTRVYTAAKIGELRG